MFKNPYSLERFSNKCRKIKTKAITLTNHNRNKQNGPIRNRSKYKLLAFKREKTRTSKSRLVLILRLIGWESGARFFNQSESIVKQNQRKHHITFDTQLKTL